MKYVVELFESFGDRINPFNPAYIY